MYGERTMVEPVVKSNECGITAEQMAAGVLNFNHSDQNEILKMIKQIVLERRQLELDETEKKAAWIRQTLEQLQ